MIKNSSQVYKVYSDYGRGWLSWDDAKAKLLALDVPADKISGVLLGTVLIPGH